MLNSLRQTWERRTSSRQSIYHVHGGGCTLCSAAVSCGQVASALAPCISYVTNGGAVPPQCCSGIRTINNSAKTTPDRQAVCKCLKSTAGSISGLKPGLVAGLPAKCGVNVPFKISTSTNCAT
ncbi:Non-specific lipid-transfer protein [Morella rubra]|uniref:Non-specific lipid-transfer protein n=1 Tax=Morella rubra TaxID=262757 RepID=A0A6A1WHD6_9ROSI|nr:Non-specific lipid-transfer protein [Morella rubra]